MSDRKHRFPFWPVTREHWDLVQAMRCLGTPTSVLQFEGGIGDQLLLTSLASELRQRGETRIWICSAHPELFAVNPDIRHVIPEFPRGARRLLRTMGSKIISPSYAAYIPSERRDTPPTKHILAVMCEQAGIRGSVQLRPYLYLTPEEKMHGRRMDCQAAIQTTGLSARYAMRTKEWFPERFQEVVNRLKDQVNFVQLGHLTDPRIEGALDLRGKTTLRESAAILANSVVFVGLVGFLMQLARAVDCYSVIVYGGRELPEQTGYVCNANIVGKAPCSPCWRYDDCPGQRMCMERIEPSTVIDAVLRRLAKAADPLGIEECIL